MLAPMEPMEERAAAARERHALHSAEGMSHKASLLLHVLSLTGLMSLLYMDCTVEIS